MITILENSVIGEYKILRLSVQIEENGSTVDVTYEIPPGDLDGNTWRNTVGTDISAYKEIVDIVDQHRAQFWNEDLIEKYKDEMIEFDQLRLTNSRLTAEQIDEILTRLNNA